MKYTVLMLYPDFIAENYGEDNYLAHVEADTVGEALAQAQRMAFEDFGELGLQADWYALFICDDWKENLLC